MKSLRAILTAATLVIASLCAHAQSDATPDSGNFHGLWWGGEAEAGWNLTLSHQGEIIFATWATYDELGKPIWFSMTARRSAPDSYSGSLYVTRAPGNDRDHFDPSLVRVEEVGSATLAFTGPDEGTFSYKVFEFAATKAIMRFQQAGLQSRCRWNALGDLTAAENLTDLWFANPPGSEPGWGVGITNIGRGYVGTLLATWLTYDANGAPTWYFGVARGAYGDFEGELFRTTGPSLRDQAWNPAAVSYFLVDRIAFDYTDGNHMHMYTTIARPKALTRFVFRGSGTTCDSR